MLSQLRLPENAVVLVCGGTDYDNYPRMDQVLTRLKPARVVNGAADGADSLATAWARWNGVAFQEYPADWRNFGLAAGPMRNGQMLAAERPDLVVAFPGHKGTRDMVKQARAANVRVILIDWYHDAP